MKKTVLLAAVAGLLAMQVGRAVAANCAMEYQHAYEKGVNDGRADGAHQYEYDPMRSGRKIAKNQDDRGNCYREGYKIGYQNASADAKKSAKTVTYGKAPKPGSNERAYYDDGCHEGTVDAQASMSMAYERHAGMYDSRFEPYFRDGYEACWAQFR